MIELAITCTGCGAEFQPAHSDYVRGCWRICPACRDGPATTGTGSHDGDFGRSHGNLAGTKVTDVTPKKGAMT